MALISDIPTITDIFGRRLDRMVNNGSVTFCTVEDGRLSVAFTDDTVASWEIAETPLIHVQITSPTEKNEGMAGRFVKRCSDELQQMVQELIEIVLATVIREAFEETDPAALQRYGCLFEVHTHDDQVFRVVGKPVMEEEELTAPVQIWPDPDPEAAQRLREALHHVTPDDLANLVRI